MKLLLLAALVIISGCTLQPKRETTATVIDITPNRRPRRQTDKVRVTFKSPDALVTVKALAFNELGCSVGDTFKASEQGGALTPDERACVIDPALRLPGR